MPIGIGYDVRGMGVPPGLHVRGPLRRRFQVALHALAVRAGRQLPANAAALWPAVLEG